MRPWAELTVTGTSSPAFFNATADVNGHFTLATLPELQSLVVKADGYLVQTASLGNVSVPGVYIGYLDRVPFWALANKRLTVKSGRTQSKIEAGKIDPSGSGHVQNVHTARRTAV